MRWRFLLVALAVLSAGCGLLADDSAQTETLTPAPIPEDSEVTRVNITPISTDRPGGAGDVGALVRGHISQLRETSYTVRYSARYGPRETETVLRVESPRRYLYRTSSSEDGAEFADGNYRYRLEPDSKQRVTRTRATNATARYGAITSRLVLNHVPPDNGTVEAIRFLEEPHFRVRVTYDDHPRLEGVRNYSLKTTITQSGLVRSMTVSYVRYDEGERTPVSEQFVYTNIGATSVTRPDWVDTEERLWRLIEL